MPEPSFGGRARGPRPGSRFARGASTQTQRESANRGEPSDPSQLLDELDRLRTENERLRSAIQGGGLGLWDHNLITHDVFRNDEWALMLGYAPEEINSRRDAWKELIHPDDRKRVDRICFEHESGQTPAFRVRHRLRTKDGGYKWILNWGGIVERDADGAAIRATGIHIDITEQKRREDERARIDKLESLGTLAAGMAHDFNNHLSVILGNLSLARTDATLGGRTVTLLDEAEKAALRAHSVTGRMLTFAQGGAPVVEALSVERALRNAVELAMLGSNVRCEIDIAPDIHVIEACQQQMEQAFANLLMNAAQAMPKGGVVSVLGRNVRLEEGECEPIPGGDYVEIAVHDQGEGILPGRIGRVFDPFFTTRDKHAGLGLSTSYHIFRRHGGRLMADSVPGSGTTFTAYVPASCEPASRVIDDSSAAVLSGTGSILVVDDQEAIRTLAQRLLAELGYTADVAADGAEAVDMYRGRFESGVPYDAVIMDLTIPGGMGGLEAAEALRQVDGDACVVVSSGYSSDPVLAEWEQYGFTDRLAKPYRMAELSQALGRAIARKRERAPDSASD